MGKCSLFERFGLMTGHGCMWTDRLHSGENTVIGNHHFGSKVFEMREVLRSWGARFYEKVCMFDIGRGAIAVEHSHWSSNAKVIDREKGLCT